MKTIAAIFLLLAIGHTTQAACNTDVKPSDPTITFIKALKCLNREINRLDYLADETLPAAKAAHTCCVETNEKLDHALGKVMKR